MLFERINQLNWSTRVTPLNLVQPSGSRDDKLKSKWSWQVVKYKTSLEKWSRSISTLIIVPKIDCSQRHCKETEKKWIIGIIQRIEFGVIEKFPVVILCTKYDCRYRIFPVQFYPTGTVLLWWVTLIIFQVIFSGIMSILFHVYKTYGEIPIGTLMWTESFTLYIEESSP